ncbi:type II toxin-antitoxin system PemK/MazF family toxin [archaeon]|nr:type II toxin-antitoxin system PemK/MazF family toxin [archaeon]
MIIKRGDILLVDLEPVKGSEQGKIRPCLVVQNDLGNANSPTTIIVPLTSHTEHEYPFTIKVKKGEANLPKESLVMFNQIRTISVQDRVSRKLGSLRPETIQKVNEALKVSLALD